MRILELGHIVLYVSDLERSRHFYGDILGWDEIVGEVPLGMPAVGFTSGRTHHELLLIEVGDSAEGVPRGRRLGLYHFGLKVGDSDEELREVLAHLKANGVPIIGASDHTVTHSLYIRDPDGNEIELYVDVLPREEWSDPAAVFAPIRPLHL
ncbi:MAG: VOC family protein [Actinobacteria bacterium]|nr:VOC family protein [Actinomycetota bacterium]